MRLQGLLQPPLVPVDNADVAKGDGLAQGAADLPVDGQGGLVRLQGLLQSPLV